MITDEISQVIIRDIRGVCSVKNSLSWLFVPLAEGGGMEINMNEMIRYIMVPVVGALIGYATNWIAVKMLFRPHHEVRVFGWKLPFTPGVIPKGQGRLARAVGRAVEEQLLNEKVLREVLLSQETRDKLAAAVRDWYGRQQASEVTLFETASAMIPDDQLKEMGSYAIDRISDSIYRRLVEANVGKIVADKAMEATKEKLSESMIGMMFAGVNLDPIAEIIEKKVNEYVEDYSLPYIQDTVRDETVKLSQKTVGEVMNLPAEYNVDVPELAVKIYVDLVAQKLPKVLAALQLSRIVENRINAMDVAEVEDLLLSIMKKELGAIVNLGALIGFVLGLINVAILLI